MIIIYLYYYYDRKTEIAKILCFSKIIFLYDHLKIEATSFFDYYY